MSARQDRGGPAFPSEQVSGFEYITGGGVRHTRAAHAGMDLRDYFAGQALIGLVKAHIRGATTCSNLVALQAYEYADAMLKEREKE